MGTLHVLCCTGGTLGSSVMLYLSGILPIFQKNLIICLKSSMLLVVIWSCKRGMGTEQSDDGMMDDLWSYKGGNVTLWFVKRELLLLWTCFLFAVPAFYWCVNICFVLLCCGSTP